MTLLNRATLMVAVAGLSAASFMSNTAWAVGAYTVTDLGTLGGSTSYAYGINASGQVVGCSDTTGDATGHAFLYSSSTMTDLGTLGGTYSYAYGINASGQVAGYSDTTGDAASHAFRYSSSTMTDLGALGTSLCLAPIWWGKTSCRIS